MLVRPASVADVALCERIEPVFYTQHVWKVEHQSGEGEFSVAFRRARLPRELPVEMPYTDEDLFAVWQRARCFLVAEERDLVLGYLVMQARGDGDEGWVTQFVVADAFSKRGVAAELLRGAEDWGRENRLMSVTVAVPSCNDPLIQLVPQRGYGFRGFMESYFPGGDAALLFSLVL